MKEYGVERAWRDMRLNRIGAGHRRDHARSHRPLLRPLSIEEVAPDDERLPAVFEVMRELRTHLSLRRLPRAVRARRIRRATGWRRCSTATSAARAPATGSMTNLVSGRHLYVDDLVTAEQWRSHGYGRLLNEYLVRAGAQRGLRDRSSSTPRRTAREAHRFYFRERYAISSFHFVPTRCEAEPEDRDERLHPARARARLLPRPQHRRRGEGRAPLPARREPLLHPPRARTAARRRSARSPSRASSTSTRAGTSSTASSRATRS